MRPLFLPLSKILELHRRQIETYGGETSVRDINLLESAIAMPESGFGDDFFHKDLFEMAAAYLFHIVQNHPFVDGNKRTGAAAALVFLAINGVHVMADEDEFEVFVRSVSRGELQKPEIAAFLKKHGKPSRRS